MSASPADFNAHTTEPAAGPCARAFGPRLLGALTVALAALAFACGSALAAAPVLLDGEGSDVASYGGWTAWSDPSMGEYALITRSPSGAISRAPIAPLSAPLDLRLGPSAAGVVAVYSRCTGPAAGQGCRIYGYNLGRTSEAALGAPGTSVHEPAIWDGELVFLRRNPSGAGLRPDNLYAWRIGAARAQAQQLPVSRGVSSAQAGRWPRGATGVVSGLTIRGQLIAYATNRGSESFGISSLWLQRIGGRPRLIDQVTSGAGAACEPEFLSPTIVGSWLYAYLHACDPSANPALDRWTRYSLSGTSAERARHTFLRTGDEEVNAFATDGTLVDWTDEGGLHQLAGVSWSPIRRPVPETFCSLADPVC